MTLSIQLAFLISSEPDFPMPLVTTSSHTASGMKTFSKLSLNKANFWIEDRAIKTDELEKFIKYLQDIF